MHSSDWDISLHCVICDDSLIFRTSSKILKRNDIATITINHHWSYDDLTIKTKQGISYNLKKENAHIKVIENGYAHQYALCKLDYIELGDK